MTAAATATEQGQQGQAPAGTGGPCPVQLTEKAAKQVLSLMERENLSPEVAGLRVSVIGGGCSGLSYKLSFEKEPKKRDRIYELQGVRVFMDPKSALYLNGTQLDFVDGLNGTGFTFTNPNANGTCGCGQSFTA